ncbi:MAG TPA: DUF885 domain-containing protein [Jatrophihabitantaceae bacterium]|nr:DUF885 domain-containing protein [Jatrophihabitantaceae bacterium]
MTGSDVNVRAIADELLHDLAPVDVGAAEALGQGQASIMPALAPADFAARHEAYRRAQRALRECGSPSDGDRALDAALRERVDSELALDDAGFATSLLAPLATPVHQVREVFDKLPHESAADWERVAEHLDRVPAALADYAETLRSAAADGHAVSARQMLGAAEQCEKWIGPDDFYRRLVANAQVADRDRLAAGAEAASAATASFATFLRTELLAHARPHDGAGRELYQVTARAFLGDDVDLDDTYAFGWDELARLTDEMREVAASLGADSIEQAAALLDAETDGRLQDDDLAGWLQQRVDEVVDAVDGVHFDLPEVARRPECAISPTSTGVMYYSPPDAAFTRPGRIWWSPPSEGVSHVWREVTTVHHEGVPGHHLQITTAMSQPDLHPWQRSMAHVHGYAEGWAHYTERLADELGLLRSAGERLGMLYGQRWRAARIVIDMGLHLGLPIPARNGFTDATTWTPEVGASVLRTASGCDAVTARFEVDRYFGWPAQALSFRVGARLWRQLRDAAANRPGFDLRAFHMGALRLGPMGLRPLRKVLLGE